MENKKEVASRRLSQEDNKEGEPRGRQEQKKKIGTRRCSCRSFLKKKDLKLILEKKGGNQREYHGEKKGERQMR